MRGRLVCGLVAAVAGVAISAAGAGGAHASLPPGPGSQLWAARYTGPGHVGVAYSVVVSPGGGRVFVTGQSAGTSGGVDYATVAYSAATGARLWAARYNGPTNTWNAASSVVVSPGGGSVFVTGVSEATSSGLDYATVAYNAATGAQQWAARYHGPATGNDAAHAVAVSPSGGTVYITGVSKATASFLDYDYATVAYNAATGAQQWAARYQGPVPSYDPALSLAVSPSGGGVYVTGQSQGTTSGDDYATVAYNAATGAQQWVKRYNGPGNGDETATSVAVSPSGGSVYITGYSQATASGVDSDYATVAYNATTGAQRWAARYTGPAPGVDVANSLAVSPTTGTVYVTGTTGDAYATVAYHP